MHTETVEPVARQAHDPVIRPWTGKDRARLPGYWLLGSLGKRVLRPGGLALSRKMIDALAIGTEDRVVEYAPGLGVTARMTLERRPQSYLAIEKEPAAAHAISELCGTHPQYRCLAADARTVSPQQVARESEATVVYGESMLTIHDPPGKRAILDTVHRMLAPQGRFAFQELSLQPADIDQSLAQTIRGQLIRAVQHPAWPLTTGQWRELAEEAGFEVVREFREIGRAHV